MSGAMSVYEPNATAARLTMEERNLHRMLQERTDDLGQVRRELHEWKARAEQLKAELAQAVKERDEARRELDEARVRIEDLEHQVTAGYEDTHPEYDGDYNDG